MGLFNFIKKKEEAKENCSCGGECDAIYAEQARFVVLGSCCKKSLETFENTKKAVAEMGFSDLVLNIGDMEQIAKYGVMSTPALVIDNKVVSYGKFLTVDDVKKIIGGL